MKQRNIVIALLVGSLFIIAGVAAVGPNTAIFKAIIVQNDAAIGNDLVVGGGLTVTGGVTGTNVLTTGSQTVAGVKTFSSAVTGTGGAAITGAAVNLNASSNFATNINTGTTNAALTLGGGSGTVAINSSDWDISTAGVMTGIGAITADGAISGLKPVLLKTANYVSTAADTGAVINTTNAMTVTLPAVAVGLNLCVYNGDGADIKIDPNTTNTVLTLTNGNGDRVTNTTIGDSVCLVGLNATSWMAMERVGTWSDGN